MAQKKRLLCQVQKQSAQTGEHGSNIQNRNNREPIVTDKPTEMLNRPRKMPFISFSREEDVIAIVPSSCKLPLKERHTTPTGGPPVCTPYTTHFRARVTIAKTKELVRDVCKLITSNRKQGVADSDVYRGFDDS